MATIKVKRTTTSTTPTGLTFGEPAFVQGLNSFYVTNSSGTSIRVGAEVDTSTTLGGAGATHNKLPTQLAVKTYIDDNIQSGSVTSVNGATGAITISGSAGITVSVSAKSIIVSNEGVQSLNISGTANGGLAVTGAGTTGALTKSITVDFSNLTAVTPAVGDLVLIGDASDLDRPKDVTIGGILDIINGDVNVDSNGTSSIAAGAIVDADIASNAAITVTKLAAFTISGHTLGNNLSTLTIGNGLNGTSYNGSAAVTISNAGVTGAAAGTGISVSSATGNVTISNTGVTGAVAGTGISVSSGTGNVTITNTGVQSLTLTATTNGGLAVSGAGTTGALSKAVTLDFSNLTAVTPAVGDLVPVGDASDSNNPKDVTVGGILDIINGDVNVDSNGTSSIAAGAIVDADIASAAAITVTKLAAFTISGHTLGNNLSTLTIGTGLGGTSYNGSSAVTITNTGVTQLTPGTGISVSAGTGNVTITNTGVQSLAGTSNQITVTPSGGTGALTLSLPSAITTPGSLTTTNDLTVGGNLTVNGTTTTVNSSTLSVNDPLIILASGNSGSDSLDIGFYGLYDQAGTDKYAGLFRDATDGKFRLFQDLQSAPTTTVNTSGTGYAAGTLVATLEGNASSATNATNASNVIATEQTTGTMYLVGMAAAGTTGALLIDATAQGGFAALSYNNATATLTAYQVEAIVDGGSYT